MERVCMGLYGFVWGCGAYTERLRASGGFLAK